MLTLKEATVIIYVTSLLTFGSTINETSETNGNPPLAIKELFEGSSTENKTPETLLTAARSIDNDVPANVSRAVGSQKNIVEGGSLKNLSEVKPQTPNESSKEPTVVAEGVVLPVANLTRILGENGTSLSVVPKKVVSRSKITPRKGVEYAQESAVNNEFKDTNKKLPILETFIVNNTSIESPVAVTEPNPSVTQDTNNKLNNNLNDTKPVVKIDISRNKTIPTVILVPSHPNISKVHKPKPTKTIGEGDNDEERMPPLPTEKPLAGMPRKIDYIVPVMITAVAVPILAVVAFILYKRGRDCWDRRHYRRMDFLIDGMYND